MAVASEASCDPPEPVKIHFCDLCNESVPQADLDEGRAFLRNGRVMCATCDELMSGHEDAPAAGAGAGGSESSVTSPGSGQLPPGSLSGAVAASGAGAGFEVPASAGQAAAPAASGTSGPSPSRPRARSGGGGMAMGFTAILAVVAGMLYLRDHEEQQEQRIARELQDLRQENRRLERQLGASIETGLLRLEDRLGSQRRVQRETRDDLLERAHESSEELVRHAAVLARLGERLEAVELLGERVEENQAETARVGSTTADLHAELIRLGQRMNELRQDQERRLAAAEPEPAPVEPEPTGPSWQAQLADLNSPNSGVRWQAVQNLGRTGDPQTAQHLVPLLRDPDIFVRMATARVLGDLQAIVGIPALIDALEDDETSVREAAVVSLRGISGQNFRFDPNSKESDRSRRVKSWRDWWKRASRDLLGEESA